jgi:hypothetical protein
VTIIATLTAPFVWTFDRNVTSFLAIIANYIEQYWTQYVILFVAGIVRIVFRLRLAIFLANGAKLLISPEIHFYQIIFGSLFYDLFLATLEEKKRHKKIQSI